MTPVVAGVLLGEPQPEITKIWSAHKISRRRKSANTGEGNICAEKWKHNEKKMCTSNL